MHHKLKDVYPPLTITNRLTAAKVRDIIGPIETPVHQGVLIKALSTIGVKPVLALLASNEGLISGWSEEDKQLLFAHATEKELALLTTINNFPRLFPSHDSKMVDQWSNKVRQMTEIPTANQRLSDDQLKETLWVRQGGLPILLTVPDDGTVYSVGEIVLPYDPRSKSRDTAVNVLVKDIDDAFTKSGSKHPSIISQRIRRKHLTPQIIAYFESQVFQALCSMGLYHQQPIYHIDLHGFSHQPPFSNYDLILGTGHRQTVKDSNFDILFAEFMEQKGYSVYIPTTEKRAGELFAATNPSTLVQRITHLKIPQVAASMQVETSIAFRRQGATEKGKQLSHDIAEFMQIFLQRRTIKE